MHWIKDVPASVAAQSQCPSIIARSASLTSLMVALVLLRAYTRHIIVKLPGSDDYITYGTAVISFVYNVLAIYQTRLGLGLPLALRPHADAAEYARINFTGRPLYMLGITGFKVALCFAYLRLTNRTMQAFRNVTWSFMAFVIVAQPASTLVIILQCHPVAESWEPTLDGWCLANYPTWNATAAITILCDVMTFLLPVPLFARLQMDRRRKFSLIFLFVLGLFTKVCSVMRMVQIRIVARDGNNSTLVLWGTAELNVGISLTCLPALVPLFKRLIGRQADTSMTYTPQAIRRSESTKLHRLSRYSKSEAGVQIPKPTHGRRVSSQDSEEGILPSIDEADGARHDGFITKTTEFHITSLDRPMISENRW